MRILKKLCFPDVQIELGVFCVSFYCKAGSPIHSSHAGVDVPLDTQGPWRVGGCPHKPGAGKRGAARSVWGESLGRGGSWEGDLLGFEWQLH